MNRTLAVGMMVWAVGISWMLESGAAVAQSRVQVPKFQYDPTFPQPLPEKWDLRCVIRMAAGNGRPVRQAPPKMSP
jgi:hypothetical protein